MVGAHEGLVGVATALGHAGAPMATYVSETPHHPVFAPHHQHRYVGDGKGDVITGVGHVGGQAGHHRQTPEQGGQLGLMAVGADVFVDAVAVHLTDHVGGVAGPMMGHHPIEQGELPRTVHASS